MQKYEGVKAFILRNGRNPSKYDAEERGQYLNWIKHNKKLYKADERGKIKMKQLGTSIHKDMSAYLQDFGFGGFVGYGGGVSVGLVKEEPRRRMMYDVLENLGLYGLSFYHLYEGESLVILCLLQ